MAFSLTGAGEKLDFGGVLKTPHQLQMQSWVCDLQQRLQGAQLQQVSFRERELLLFEFYAGQSLFLGFSLNKAQPQMLFFQQEPQLKKKSLPLALFLQAHARNRRWRTLQMREGFGRVLDFFLGSEQAPVQLEISLIPHQVNVRVMAEGKGISFVKPQELKPLLGEISSASASPHTSLIEFSQQWLGQGSRLVRSSVRELPVDFEKMLERKQRALQGLRESENLSSRLYELGEQLKSHAELSPLEQGFLRGQGLDSRNFEGIFLRAKKEREKERKIQERIRILESELAKLKEAGRTPTSPASPASEEGGPPLPKALSLPSGAKNPRVLIEKFWVQRGRNAKDNLRLLRSAAAWHWWIHLRDEPGAYAILSCERKEEVPKEILAQAARWLIRSSVKRHWVGMEKFSVVATRCQFVHPIKGETGLVTYRNALHFSVAAEARQK